MSVERIRVVLNSKEYEALARQALIEMRTLPDQARWLIRKGLELGPMGDYEEAPR